MRYQSYSDEIDRYTLMEGFALERAESEAFVRAWAVYRRVNEDYAQSFAETQAELAGVKPCFWVTREGRRVAGLILLPNRLGDFFLIPPASDAHAVLAAVMPLLRHWSDAGREISAQAIVPDYLDAFQRAGFVPRESRVWMIRPAEPMAVSWPSKWELTALEAGQAKAIASLLENAFTGGVGQYGRRDFDGHLASVEAYFADHDADSVFARASALIFHARTWELAGVCMVDVHKGLPTIRMVAVAQSYRRLGLATLLVERAITALAAEYDYVKLAVTETNPAMRLYRDLGFVAGDALYDLSLPAGR